MNKFKKFIYRLYKKGDETLLNRKKKREEIKQKNKLEKLNNMNNINPYNNYYQGMYLPPPLHINNQNPAYYNEYQNIYYLNPQTYQIPPGMVPPYLPPQFMFPPKNLEESINAVYERGIVNNIIAAFYIKECQEKIKNNEKRTVPISTVDLNNNESDNNNEENKDNLDNNINNKENNDNDEAKNNVNKDEEQEEKKEEEKEDQNEQNEHSNDNELTRPNVL